MKIIQKLLLATLLIAGLPINITKAMNATYKEPYKKIIVFTSLQRAVLFKDMDKITLLYLKVLK